MAVVQGYIMMYDRYVCKYELKGSGISDIQMLYCGIKCNVTASLWSRLTKLM